jgi:FkbH-like protein
MEFLNLKKNLNKDFSDFPKVKIAVLGDSSTQLLVLALRGIAYEKKIDLIIYEAEFNQIDQEILDTHSGLYRFEPDCIYIFESSPKLQEQFYKLPADEQSNFADNHLLRINQFCAILSKNISSRFIYSNFSFHQDSIYGNFANSVEASLTYQMRKINFELMVLAKDNLNLVIQDLNALQVQNPSIEFHNATMFTTADMVLSLDFYPILSKSILEIVECSMGHVKKCVIVDLDNTLWGGIIGEEGLENIQIGDLGIGKAFTRFQYWLKQLKNRGIILAVCSKNDELIAREPFEKHPNMILKMDDFSVFMANWKDKNENIAAIQKILNIAYDSMVFLDDNPFERELVRSMIKGITVPELPTEAGEYVNYLASLNMFETLSQSKNDHQRTKQYQDQARRETAKESFSNINDYLISLDMSSEIKHFNSFNLPRVEQLVQRSNQFNLRTQRHSATHLDAIRESDKFIDLTFTLKDKFGDNGLIAVVILEKRNKEMFIDTWLMSCRILRRGVENFVLNAIVDKIKRYNCELLIGEYIETKKNNMVKGLLPNLGFRNDEDRWVLKVQEFNNREHFIKELI